MQESPSTTHPITTTWPARVWAFVCLGRPLFLSGGFLMYWLGAAMAAYNGYPIRWGAFIWGQAAVSAVQVMTQYSNEYFDLAIDRANPTPTRWAGGSQVLPEGRLSPRAALVTAVVMAISAIGAGVILALAVRPGPLALPLILIGLILAWEYSAPPLRLHSRGMGELTVGLIVPGMTPLLGFYLLAGELAILPVLAAVPLVCLQVASMLTIEFPDAAGDAASGKRTLVVRLGAERAARLHNLLLLLAYASLPVLVQVGLPSLAALLMSLSAPVATWQGWRMARRAWADPAHRDSVAFWGFALLMGTAGLALLAFTILIGLG